MSWSGHHTMDPSELETRYSVEDGMGFLDSVFEEPSEESQGLIKIVRDILSLLPAREADFVDLYFFKKLKQTEIADLFEVSQPTVCYRLQRATSRIQFLLKLPKVEELDLKIDLENFLSDPLDVNIMLRMWKTTCQSEVAKSLGVSQGLVRHRFLRTIKKMKDNKISTGSEKFDIYIDLFEFISKNLNILREIQRPLPNGEEITLILD